MMEEPAYRAMPDEATPTATTNEDPRHHGKSLSVASSDSALSDKNDDIDVSKWRQRVHDFMSSKQQQWIYMWTVLNYGITCYAAGGGALSGLLPWYYSIKFPVMILARFLAYKQRSWQWFLLDFCYWSNTALLVFLWIYPNAVLFCFVFALSNGPLLWSIIIFGNSLVFHSLDKTTSLLIHVTPAVITYVLRWHMQDDHLFDVGHRWTRNICVTDGFEADYNADRNGCANWWTNVCYPFMFAVAQQCIYGVLMQCLCYAKIVNDPHALTTFRYLFPKDARQGTLWKIVNVAGKRFRVYIWGMFFVCFATVTYIPTMLLYRFEWMHAALIVVCLLVAVRTGSQFYAKVFANKSKTNQTAE